MEEYGERFQRPKINQNPFPGSWTHLKGTSSFVSSATEFILDHIRNKLHYSLPPTVKIRLITAGIQIVSGINIYLEIRLDGERNLDVQTMIYDSRIIRNKNRDTPSIEKLYISAKPFL